MSDRKDILLLEDIIESCEKIQKYVKDITFNDFVNDDKTFDAVIRNFEIIGEAANRLSNEIYISYSEVNWKQIVGLRNRLVHAYFGVDYEIIWSIINENLDDFRDQIFAIKDKIKKLN